MIGDRRYYQLTRHFNVMKGTDRQSQLRTQESRPIRKRVRLDCIDKLVYKNFALWANGVFHFIRIHNGGDMTLFNKT